MGWIVLQFVNLLLMFLRENSGWHTYCIYLNMRYIFILIIFFSSNLFAQGNLGVNFGLNDDNFGSIENIKNKIDNYNLDIKNSTGFQFGVFTEIDLITFYIRPEFNLIFSKSKNASAFEDSSLLDQSINIAEHSYK